MYLKDRQKMCANCDGRVPVDAEACPYCAADLKTAAPQAKDAHQSIQDSLTALYSPPYAKNPHLIRQTPSQQPAFPFQNTQLPKEPMVEKRFNPSSPSLGAPVIPADTHADQAAQESKNSFWPILILSIAANLLMLGLLQLFFSDEGFLRLEWDSSYWFVYCLAALPLLYFGFRKVNTL